MVYRASVLLKIPIPILVKLLGLDLPAPPRVSLHGIASDSVTLHWSLPEKPGSVAKHIIHINGINVGESERRGETSVTVTGLNPDHLYNVRVIAANQHNFQAPGQLIRLRTRRKSHDGAEGASGGSKVKGEHADDSPSIQPHTPALDAYLSPQQQQHGHHHNPHGKRVGRERKQASSISEQQQIGSSPVSDEQHTVESLTAELEAVSAEIDDLEAQMLHAEEELKASEGVLVTELDLLKEKKRCEDVGRHQLRTETRSLEEAKRIAEAQKTKTERALKAKEDEVRKMQQESRKWEEERLAALERAERLSKEAEESKGRAQSTEKELNVEIVGAQAKISELEEEIRTVIATIKAMEAEKEQLKVYLGHAASQSSHDEALEREWLERQKNLEMRYVSVFNAFNLAQEDLNRSREALAFWKTRRDSAPVADNQSIKKSKQRRNRNRKSRTHTLSHSEPPFPMQDPRFLSEVQGFPNQVLQASSLSPSYAANNVPTPYFGSVDDSLNDDRLNGSTLMSPTADSLLPSDLFSSVADPPSPKSHRNSLIESLRFLPQSPMSSGSRSTSHVSSPRSSFHHTPLFPAATDGLGAESDRAAVSPMNCLRGRGQSPTETISGTRRIVNLFSFNKQRVKTLPLEPPLLGSLKPAESRSFPQNFADLPSLDPIGTRRRSGSHGSWNLGSMHFLNGKKDAQSDSPEAPKLSRLHHEYPRQERLFDRSEPVSPRPLSMTSFDGVLPRPSSGVSAAFGWPAEPTNPAKPSRLSMHSTNWSDWSSSRKPSSSLSHNNNNNASTTSFQSSLSRPSQPRLNPTAPTFESSLIKPSFLIGRDSMSIHDDTSQTDASSFATADSASGSVLEIVPTKESLFSRLSLSRKGSTSKFNISWKKEGGLFSRGKQKDHSSTTEAGGGEESGEQTPENSMFLPLPSIATSERDKTWKKDGFFSRKKDPASDTGDEAEREREKDTTVELTSMSSPWLKKDGTGFFSRKPKEEREGEKEEKGGKRASVEVGSPAGGRRESFFGKRDKEKGKEREGEKKEIVEVNEEGEGGEVKA
ncbi:hypothetical protein L211DRAFT_403523 [Terfezia boudieri ATCC MYA-4762]|uniref:Fibronectin type-III domain-containing protein n=1 Tax=Terfezia boudieri ATCC MYA-4762 TaxID=1051890 RepID=A0A3N4M0U8_9PEZI|nr:hypothetical protein L211DRAFT_403523 [Terfezia boudieri ATCC MYA-4762]